MPESRVSLHNLWTSRHRPALHKPENWSTSAGECKLMYTTTGKGFKDYSEMKTFCNHPDNLSDHIFSSGTIQSINCFVDENSGQVIDEFLLNWNQKVSRMDWMLGENDFPLQKYVLTFVISAQIDPSSGSLKSVRIYWDQASLLLQTGLLKKSLRNLVKSDNSDALEGILTSLPINLSSSEGVQIGALNNITSILSELPKSTAGLAVSTPQRRSTCSRSLNPALLGVMNFSEESSAKFFDSPAPANQRSVKSRPGLFDDMNSKDSYQYKPSFGSSAASIQSAKSDIFSQSSSPSKSESSSCHYPQVNSAQTDKILFESHVFDGVINENEGEIMKSNATAPPQCPSHILSPEESLKIKPDHFSKSLSRPGMIGHFHGSSFGSKSQEDVQFIPSTAIRFDPNRSQIYMGDGQDLSSNSTCNSTKKSVYDPNRSQIVLGDGCNEPTPPSNRTPFIPKPSIFD